MIIAALANLSVSYPEVLGIILTAGFEPEEPNNEVIARSSISYSVILVHQRFETSTKSAP